MKSGARNNDKTSKTAMWFALAFTFLFAITWSLPSFFNWIFFSGAAYSFFLYWYYNPGRSTAQQFKHRRAPKFHSENAPERVNLISINTKQFVGLATAGIVVIFFMVQLFSRADQSLLPDVGFDGSEYGELDQATIWNNMGYNFYLNSQYDSALFYFDKSLQLESSNGQSWYYKGMVYYDQQQGDRAFEAFSRAYSAGVRDAFLSHALAYYNDTRGNTTVAIGYYKEAVALDSTRSNIYARLAELEPSKEQRYRELYEKWKNE